MIALAMPIPGGYFRGRNFEMNERYRITDYGGIMDESWDEHGPQCVLVFELDKYDTPKVAELVRRANALPTVEAQLDEAVDIIRRAYAQSQEAEPGCICDWCREMRAFLELNGGVE